MTTTDDLRPATESETAEWLAGHIAPAGAIETPEGLMLPKVERLTRSYDPSLDTARVDEAVVRALVGIGCPLPGVGTIILQGRFLRGGVGSYGAVYVLCAQANGRGYSTNQAIVRAEDGQPITVFAEHGHYDMTREDAEADLATR